MLLLKVVIFRLIDVLFKQTIVYDVVLNLAEASVSAVYELPKENVCENTFVENYFACRCCW